jgi:radical SAM protein with 4Fe4S-binding SPASM domain
MENKMLPLQNVVEALNEQNELSNYLKNSTLKVELNAKMNSCKSSAEEDDNGQSLEVYDYLKTSNLKVELNAKMNSCKSSSDDCDEGQGLEVFDIALLTACNLFCKHCYWGEQLKEEDCLSFKHVSRLLHDGKKLGVRELVLTGGEVMIYPKIWEVLALARELKYRINFYTNATLIDETNSKRIAELGVYKAHVSVDGLQNLHDYIRGRGMFEKTIKGIHLLRQAGLEVVINTQLTDELVKQGILDYIKFVESLGVDFLLLTPPFPEGNARTSKIKPATDLKLIRTLENQNKHHLAKGEKTHNTCLALIKELAVGPDGTVYPCHFFRSLGLYSLGNILRDDIVRIYEENKNSPLAKFMNKEMIPKDCSGCEYLDVCDRNPVRVFATHQTFDGVDPLSCLLNKDVKLGTRFDKWMTPVLNEA